MALLKEHRHRVSADGKAMRVVLVTQEPSDLATWTRKLVEVSYRMEKLTAVGLGKRFRVDIYKTCPTGDFPPKRLLIRQTQGTYKPEIYQYYRSATQSEAETLNVGDETIADKRGSIWQSKWLIFCLVIGVAFPVLGVWGVIDFFARGAQEAPAEPVLVNPMPEPAQMVAVSAAAPVEAPEPVLAVNPAPEVAGDGSPPISQAWRVGGFVSMADKDAPETPAAWDSVEGYQGGDRKPISRTTRVVLQGPYGHRFVALDRCQFYPEGIDVYCDIDGERVTPWSGGGQMDGMVSAGISQAGQTVGVRTQQSEGRTPTD
jgi:zona occludens toxin